MIFSAMLMYIAGVICIVQMLKKNAWPLICFYWFVLTVKYGYELWLR